MQQRSRRNWTSTEKCWTASSTLSTRWGGTAKTTFACWASVEASGDDLERARSRHLGDTRRTSAIHLFKDDGVGRFRSCRAACRSTSLRCSGGEMENIRDEISPRDLRQGSTTREQLRPGLRFAATRRSTPADASGRFLAG